MTDVAQRDALEQAVPLTALFTAFLAVSLCGVGGGGGIVWARRIAVENRRWISDREFADIVSLCQFMPGPNIVTYTTSVTSTTIRRLIRPESRWPLEPAPAGSA